MKKHFFSGIQPSGKLHIGNYLGAIKQWIALQDQYEPVFGIVDYHAMTVRYDPAEMGERVLDAAASYLAAGLDPSKSILMVQSDVPEHTELAWIMNCITPMGRLSRIPTFKEKVRQHPDNVNMGLFDYPVLMAADILLYKSEIVPVGEDQVPHLEFTREVARRFNAVFGETFPEPAEVLSTGARILGLDGVNKMSKSLDNCIYLDDTDEDIRKKLATAFTDPARKRRDDPGDPDICNIMNLHRVFSTPEEQKRCAEGCREASIGCVDCKKILMGHMMEMIAPLRERKADLLARPDDVRDILRAGAERARPIARATMDEVRRAVGVSVT
ncbi:MAG: tryptophan--tRNA ligase [Candidatus Eisenbacteria bacterium]|nr:tryptophan--tRNA ligase [Candidatus Eisenbacteria bacterium]